MLLKIIFFSISLLAGDVKFVDLKKTDFSFVSEIPKSHDGRCLLREEAAQALLRAQKVMQLTGNRIKLLECYVPDLIAKPNLIERKKKRIGFDFESAFSRAGAVAATVVDREGREFLFPGMTFSGKRQKITDPNLIKVARANLEKLRTVMKNEGFEAYPQVSWFFVFKPSKEWPFLNIPFSEIP